MTKENGVKVLTDMVADFVAHIGKKLPDDVVTKLEELGSQESAALPKVLYETMTKNQGLAVELNRPSCQDTGVLQFWLKCGTNFPYINELEALLKEAVVQATFAAPLRHNSVETFDEYNTKKNVGKGTSCVLTAWTVQFYSQSLVLGHCLIKYFWECCTFLRAKFFQFFYYVVR